MGHLNPECTLYWCEERSRVIKTSQGGSISTLADNDDSLQNDYVVKCQSRSCLRETAAAKQWAWESEWVYFLFIFFFFYSAGPRRQMDTVMSKDMISESERRTAR